ncbi:MAG: sugar ABC transporter ATP-binding protein [Candidatus Humimicrobiaceae bacterium]
MDNDGVIIKVENVTKRFGGTVALDNVSFEIKKGEVHAIVGENGAGKSTMMKILAGVYKEDSGKLYIDGAESKINNPLQARAHGISIVFQELNLFPELTVADNIFIENEKKGPLGILKKSKMAKASEKLLKSMQQEHFIDPLAFVNELSVADQQVVEITRALSHGSEILILDEPNSALSEKESQNLFKLIRKLKNGGITIIYVSHRLEEVFGIADKITVFRDGNYIGTKNIKDTTISEIISEMIGKKITDIFPLRKTVDFGSENVLEIKNLSKRNLLEPLDFFVKKGEVLGFAGLEGCGIENIFRMLFGLERKDSGEIYYIGKHYKKLNPWNAVNIGWGFVPAERHKQGLMLEWSIKNNMIITILERLVSKTRFINASKAGKVAKEYVKKLNVATDSIDKPVKELSGGNQQKVVIAKWLATEPKLLILDDPTRGIDVGAKAEIYKLINELAQAGFAIMFTSSEMNEIIELCDRILVVFNGKLVKTFEGYRSTSKAELTENVTGGFMKDNNKNSKDMAEVS